MSEHQHHATPQRTKAYKEHPTRNRKQTAEHRPRKATGMYTAPHGRTRPQPPQSTSNAHNAVCYGTQNVPLGAQRLHVVSWRLAVDVRRAVLLRAAAVGLLRGLELRVLGRLNGCADRRSHGRGDPLGAHDRGAAHRRRCAERPRERSALNKGSHGCSEGGRGR